MDSDLIINKKNIKHLQALPHVIFKLEDLERLTPIPLEFTDGKWYVKLGVS
jgi:hypothetical protein